MGRVPIDTREAGFPVARYGGPVKGAVIGTIVGSVAGFAVGSYTPFKQQGKEVGRCLTGKGYSLLL